MFFVFFGPGAILSPTGSHLEERVLPVGTCGSIPPGSISKFFFMFFLVLCFERPRKHKGQKGSAPGTWVAKCNEDIVKHSVL